MSTKQAALQERKKKMRAEAAEAAARGEMGGGAGPDPLRGGLYDENNRLCISPGDGGQQNLLCAMLSSVWQPTLSVRSAKRHSTILDLLLLLSRLVKWHVDN